MARYRMLAPHYIGTRYFEAGEIVTDIGAGALLPSGWRPTPGVDPLDAAAIQAFWSAGPIAFASGQPFLGQGLWGHQGGRWTGTPITPPLIYWKPHDLSEDEYILTGAGAALGPKEVPHVPFNPQSQ